MRHVHQVEPAPIDLRRIHRGGRLGESSIQARSLKLSAPRIAGQRRGRNDAVDTVASDGRGEQHRRVFEKRVALVRVADKRGDLAASLRGHVPLVAHDYHRAIVAVGETGEPRILIGDPLARVDHEQDDVRAANRFDRASD